jgi:chromosome segregation ATPase
MTIPAEAARTCGYSECRQQLNYHGLGRPPEYCADRRWPADDPAGRTCKQMAAQERTAQRAVGLDLMLASYHASAASVVPVAETLLERLADLLTTTSSVGEGALASVASAENAMTDAVERAATAEAAAEQARRGETAAIAARDSAIADQVNATEAAREARAAADEQVRTALADVAEAQRARGVAEANAVASARGATEAENGRAAAVADARALTTALQDAREQHATALRSIDEVGRRADLAEAATAHVRELLDAVHAAKAADESRIAALVAENQRADARIRDMESHVEQLRGDALAARADFDAAATRVAAADERAERAEVETRALQDRYDRLLSRLLDASEEVPTARTPA